MSAQSHWFPICRRARSAGCERVACADGHSLQHSIVIGRVTYPPSTAKDACAAASAPRKGSPLGSVGHVLRNGSGQSVRMRCTATHDAPVLSDLSGSQPRAVPYRDVVTCQQTLPWDKHRDRAFGQPHEHHCTLPEGHPASDPDKGYVPVHHCGGCTLCWESERRTNGDTRKGVEWMPGQRITP